MGFASILVSSWRKVQADVRREESANAATAEFNARWQKLNAIGKDVTERFAGPVLAQGHLLTESESQSLSSDIHEVSGTFAAIAENIDGATVGDLSLYATRLQRLALLSLKLCKKYQIYNGINSIEFLTFNKMLVLNSENLYCFD